MHVLESESLQKSHADIQAKFRLRRPPHTYIYIYVHSALVGFPSALAIWLVVLAKCPRDLVACLVALAGCLSAFALLLATLASCLSALATCMCAAASTWRSNTTRISGFNVANVAIGQ